MARTDAAVKDMEAAAVAWAAELYKVPYFALKVVTDIGAWRHRAAPTLTTPCMSACLGLSTHFKPFIPINPVDGKHATEDEFVANFSMAQKRLQEAVPATLDFIKGRDLQDL